MYGVFVACFIDTIEFGKSVVFKSRRFALDKLFSSEIFLESFNKVKDRGFNILVSFFRIFFFLDSLIIMKFEDKIIIKIGHNVSSHKAIYKYNIIVN